MSAGFFITLEGGEGAGKTTQIKKLSAFLKEKGHDVIETREPGGTKDAEALRDLFIAHKGQHWPPIAQALLMFTGRTLHIHDVIRPALNQNKIVICDRFTDSTRVYQGYGMDMDKQQIERLKEDSIGDFEPDLTFILDIDPKIGLVRAHERTEGDTSFEEKTISFHQNLRKGFIEIGKQFPQRCVTIDAQQSVEEISEAITKTVLERLP